MVSNKVASDHQNLETPQDETMPHDGATPEVPYFPSSEVLDGIVDRREHIVEAMYRSSARAGYMPGLPGALEIAARAMGGARNRVLAMGSTTAGDQGCLPVLGGGRSGSRYAGWPSVGRSR